MNIFFCLGYTHFEFSTRDKFLSLENYLGFGSSEDLFVTGVSMILVRNIYSALNIPDSVPVSVIIEGLRFIKSVMCVSCDGGHKRG